MDKATSDILAKVKKLMALGESPSEAEAASALEKARILLARYSLSLTDIDSHATDVVEGVLLEKKRLRSWESHLIQVIAQSTFTQALHVNRGGRGQVLLIGREINTVAAADLFAYLHLTVLKLGRAHSAKVAHLESFRRGVVQRIGERIAEESAGLEKTGGMWAGSEKVKNADDRQLMVVMEATASRENDAYISGKFGKIRSKKVGRQVDASSYHRGRAAGNEVSLNRQIL